MPDPTPTAVAAPPTAQEALEAFGEIENDCSMPMGKTPAGIAAALGVLRAFISAAAAEADAWAKIEAWCEGKPPDTAASVWREGVVWSCAVYNSDNDYEAYKNRWDAPTRLAALQLAAAWCEKEGA